MTLRSRKSPGVFVDDVLELAPIGVRKIAALSDAVEQARMLRPQQCQKAALEWTHAQNVERVEIPVDTGIDHADLFFHLQRRELGLLEKLGQSCPAIEQALRRGIEVRAELGEGSHFAILRELSLDAARDLFHRLGLRRRGHARYGASSRLMRPAPFFIAVVCAEEPTRDTDRPTFTAGRMPWKNRSVSRKIWPSVIEMALGGT